MARKRSDDERREQEERLRQVRELLKREWAKLEAKRAEQGRDQPRSG